MARKKSDGGKHITPRITVNFPAEWHAVARKLAARNRQPVLYTMIELLAAEAKRAGFDDIPTPPWDEEDE